MFNLPSGNLSYAEYLEHYKRSLSDNEEFWRAAALKYLHWDKPFTKVKTGDMKSGDVSWFEDGEINACYNVLDRHANKRSDDIALIYVADDPVDSKKITYGELLKSVSRVANWLGSLNYLKSGDIVTIYMPMIVEAVVCVLACSRLGIIHSVVFGGFGPGALKKRIKESCSKLVITCNQGVRGGKIIELKKILDEALLDLSCVKNVLVHKRIPEEVSFDKTRDIWWHDVIPNQPDFCPPRSGIGSETPLFLLYTSGSTGNPKGIIHTTGGYLLYAAMTAHLVFDLKKGDVFGCMADIGWITGHSYVVYGPLCIGVSTVLFESTPVYPDPSRYWQIVQEYGITQFYTSPTAIRILQSKGDGYVDACDLSTLRVIGSVGEPLNPKAGDWFHKVVGKGRCTLVNTYWQTETGGIVISPLPGGMPTKLGSVSLPFFGIEPAIVNPDDCNEVMGEGTGMLVMKRPWPGMARTMWLNHDRFLRAYFMEGGKYFYMGDGAHRDSDGLIWITGRVDDVMNISGHRINTSEVENIVNTHKCIVESAAFGADDIITGQSICICVVTKNHIQDLNELKTELNFLLRKKIGPIAVSKTVIKCKELPKTRSGKIMRRILRTVFKMKDDSDDVITSSIGDTTTLVDPKVVPELIREIKCFK